MRQILLSIGVIVSIAPWFAATAKASWLGSEWAERIPFSVSEGLIPAGPQMQDFALLLQLDSTSFDRVFALADSAGQAGNEPNGCSAVR